MSNQVKQAASIPDHKPETWPDYIKCFRFFFAHGDGYSEKLRDNKKQPNYVASLIAGKYN